MGIDLNTESDVQFLARMILMTREQHQITNRDSIRLSNLSQFGSGPVPPTMPEERRDGSQALPDYVVNG